MDATLRCNTKHALQTPHSLPCFFAGPLPRGDCDLHSGQTSCSVGQPSFGVHAVLPHDQALSTRCWWEHGCSGPLSTSHPGACDVGLVMLVSSRFLHFHVTLLPYLTVKWLLRRYSKVIGHWGLIPHQTSTHQPQPPSTVTLWNLSPLSQLPAFFLLGLLVTILQKTMLALPWQSLTHSSTNSDLPLFDDLCSVTVLFCFDAQIVSDLATGSRFVRVSLAFGTFSASSKQSLTSWQHRIVLVSAWSQPFLQGPLVPFSRGRSLETRIWVFRFSLCTGALWFLGPCSSQTHTHPTHNTHAHSGNLLCSCLCTLIIDHLFTDFPGGPVVKTVLLVQGVWVWSLVRNQDQTPYALWCSQKRKKTQQPQTPHLCRL